MKNTLIVEFASIRLRPEATEADLVRSSDALQRDFLDSFRGCLGRLLLKKNESEFLDVVLWASREAADAVIAAATASPSCSSYFSCMVMGDDVAEGVEHLEVVRSYGFEVPVEMPGVAASA